MKQSVESVSGSLKLVSTTGHSANVIGWHANKFIKDVLHGLFCVPRAYLVHKIAMTHVEHVVLIVINIAIAPGVLDFNDLPFSQE